MFAMLRKRLKKLNNNMKNIDEAVLIPENDAQQYACLINCLNEI